MESNQASQRAKWDQKVQALKSLNVFNGNNQVTAKEPWANLASCGVTVKWSTPNTLIRLKNKKKKKERECVCEKDREQMN